MDCGPCPPRAAQCCKLRSQNNINNQVTINDNDNVPTPEALITDDSSEA